MALKEFNFYNKPKKIFDLACHKDNDDSVTIYGQLATANMFNTLWTNQSEDEQELVSILTSNVSMYFPWIDNQTFTNEIVVSFLTDYIYRNYGKRELLPQFFDYIASWDNDYDDYNMVYRLIEENIKNCIATSRYKWTNLYKSCILEFNPLWNVDATETTTRTLEQDGTITAAKTGTETGKKTGTDTLAKTGTDTLVHSGTVADERNTTDTLTKSGSEETSYKFDKTTEKSNTTTESSALYMGEQTVESGLAANNADTLSYNNRSDATAHTGTDTRRFNNTDATTLNLQDQTTYNSTDQLTHNTTDTTTKDLLDTERIILERHGNIGITQSTQLLESFRRFVEYNLIDIIAHDIVNYISLGVY